VAKLQKDTFCLFWKVLPDHLLQGICCGPVVAFYIEEFVKCMPEMR